jgi:tryptophan halogenase
MRPSNIKSLVIVGGGTAGWMVAAALVKIFGPRVRITLVESDEIGTIGVGEATIPPINLFNGLLRLDEDEFIRETQGTFKLGIEFRDWYKPGHAYMHAFGNIGKDLAYIPFHHYWLNEVLEGRKTSLWDYSFGYQAALHGRFDRMSGIKDSPLQGLIYAFHFDATLYAAYLRRFAQKLGVVRREGRVTEVLQRPDDGYIASVKLENGEAIDGDFFIDCSGFRGLLIEGALKTGYEHWSDWLPCDRALAVPCEAVTPIIPYTRATAHGAGWQWRIPLQHRTGNGHVYASSHMSDDEAHDILLRNLDGKPLADARPIRFTTGRRRQFWNKNCIAVGLAGGFLEPLESTSIHLIQTAIDRMVMMFPHEGDNPHLREAYNRSAIQEYDFVRDFIILHYHANAREGEAFWDACRHMPIPDSLREKIELFREAAAIHPTPYDLFQLPSWLQVMWGQGIVPKTAHPFVQTISPADRAEYLGNIKSILAHEAQRLPTQAAFIARHCRAPALA